MTSPSAPDDHAPSGVTSDPLLGKPRTKLDNPPACGRSPELAMGIPSVRLP